MDWVVVVLNLLKSGKPDREFLSGQNDVQVLAILGHFGDPGFKLF